MKKILLVAADGFSKTGVPMVFMNIVKNLSKEGFTFDIIFFDKRFNFFYEDFKSFGGKAFLIDKQFKTVLFRKAIRYFSNKRYYLKTKKIIEENGPYLAIHCFNEYRSAPFLKAAYEMNVPIRIYHNNNNVSIGGNPVNRIMMKNEKEECIKYLNRFVSCSKESSKTAFSSIPPMIINNPYDDKNFYYNTDKQESISKIKIVQTASYCKNKNQLFSIYVLKSIIDKGFDADLSFVGWPKEKKYFNKMLSLINKLKVKEKVSFYNFDANLKEIYDAHNYFLLPSFNEAFGIVLIEAQASGLKCFASLSVPEAVEVGGCVRLSIDESPSCWADKIISDFVSSKGKKEKYNCSAFLNSSIMHQYLELYTQLG